MDRERQDKMQTGIFKWKSSVRILFTVVGRKLASCHKNPDSNILMELSRNATRMFVYKRK